MPIVSITPGMLSAAQHRHPSFAVDALIALALFMLLVFAMIAVGAVLGSADPAEAVAAVADGRMLILPP